jgi:hypothetical protein
MYQENSWPGYANVASVIQSEAKKPGCENYPLATLVGCMFIWSESPQGLWFWKKVEENILGL